MSTDIGEFFTDLDAGIFAQKLSKAISQCAGSSIDLGRSSKITIELSFKQLGSSHQVSVSHNLKYKVPTSKGDLTETNSTSTPMHVGTGGKVTLFPENQGQLFGKDGAVKTQQ